MSEQTLAKQKTIRLGSHGEDYGSWMSNPVFYMMGGGAVVGLILAALCFRVFRIPVLGILFTIALIGLLLMLVWITWIRCQYSFGGGRMMEKVHQCVLSHMDYDGKGKLLEVGCGSAALSIRAALTWPETEVTGVDYWGAVYNYSQKLCEKNAASEGVGSRCTFVYGDANKLDLPEGEDPGAFGNAADGNRTGTLCVESAG